MKTIHVPFDDEEFEKLLLAKGKNSWREFINSLIINKPSQQPEVSKPKHQ